MSQTSTIQKLQHQLEFYFSQSNLSVDSYLVSQMDENKYVPLSLIANFPKVQAIATSYEDLVTAAETCSSLELDEAKKLIRAKPVARTTVVMRRVPADFTEDKIRALFEADKDLLDKIVSITADIANTWNITLQDEESTLATSRFLSLQKIDGEPISCFVRQVMTAPLPVNARPYVPQNYQRSQQRAYDPTVGQSAAGGVATGAGYQGSAKSSTAPRDRRDGGNRQRTTGTDNRAQQRTRNHRPIGYTGAYIKYTREEMAAIANQVAKLQYNAPSSFNHDKIPILRQQSDPIRTTQLLNPIPVMFPLSPSPELAQQPPPSRLPPFLDLSSQLGPSSTGTAPYPGTLPSLDGSSGQMASLPPSGSLPSLSSLSQGAFTSITESLQPSTASAASRKPTDGTSAQQASARNAARNRSTKDSDAQRNVTASGSRTGSSTTATGARQPSQQGGDRRGGNVAQQGGQRKTTAGVASSTGRATTGQQQQQQQRRKQVKIDANAFPALGGASTTTTTTSTSTTSTNFASIVASQPSPHVLQNAEMIAQRNASVRASEKPLASTGDATKSSDAAKSGTDSDKKKAAAARQSTKTGGDKKSDKKTGGDKKGDAKKAANNGADKKKGDQKAQPKKDGATTTAAAAKKDQASKKSKPVDVIADGAVIKPDGKPASSPQGSWASVASAK